MRGVRVGVCGGEVVRCGGGQRGGERGRGERGGGGHGLGKSSGYRRRPVNKNTKFKCSCSVFCCASAEVSNLSGDFCASVLIVPLTFQAADVWKCKLLFCAGNELREQSRVPWASSDPWQLLLAPSHKAASPSLVNPTPPLLPKAHCSSCS